jgi:hypothetical protein
MLEDQIDQLFAVDEPQVLASAADVLGVLGVGP